MDISDNNLLSMLRNNKVAGLKNIYDIYYLDLFRFAFKYTHSREAAEEIIQDVFIQIWEKRQIIEITRSLKSYLFSAVKNQSINYLRSKYKKYSFTEITDKHILKQTAPADEGLIGSELSVIIEESVESLPPKCKLIYKLSRDSEMSYEEIAIQLGISKRTVQTQIGIALKKIRQHLGNKWDDIPGRSN